VTGEIEVAPNEMFQKFIAIELPDIMHQYGPIPSVVGTRDQTGPWDIPGSSRIVELADGGTAFEEVTASKDPSYFAYRVSRLTGIFGRLVMEAEGEWVFQEAPSGRTLIQWTYTFYARNWLAKLLLIPVVRIFWKGYMRNAFEATKRIAELEEESSS